MPLGLLMRFGMTASHTSDGICWLTSGIVQAHGKLNKAKRNVIESDDDEDVIEEAHTPVVTSDASEGSVRKRRKVRCTAC